MRAVGVVRVSKTRDDGVSPDIQAARIAEVCGRDGITLTGTFEELDVSGSRSLERRPGLLQAVEAVERREAEVLVVAYFDRLVRSLTVQAQILERVERAGGRVLAADVGEISNHTAAKWLSATMLGMVAEYHNRITSEKTAAARARAVAQGIPPMRLPPGLRRDGDRIVIEPAPAKVVREAFQMRADGYAIQRVREFLAGRGIVRSYHGTQSLLRSRLVIGEIHFAGQRGNCPAVVDRELWEAAQLPVKARGPRVRSERLLARLGVLRCGSCGAPMGYSSQSQRGKHYPMYRCQATVSPDCRARVVISAEPVERVVAERVMEAIEGIVGKASDEQAAREAQAELDAAQRALDAAVQAFTGMEAEASVVQRLRELRDTRDELAVVRDHLRSQSRVLSIAAGADWDRLTLDERRALVSAVVERVVVAPAVSRRGDTAGRVSVFLVE